jgi:hypothetical protein
LCCVFRSLDGGQNDGSGWGCFLVFVFFLHHLLDEKVDGAFTLFRFADFSARSEDAEGGVGGDLLDCLSRGCRLVA